MPFVSESRHKVLNSQTGRGFINSVINKLPFELHLPGGYQFCGPGTKFQKRIARGDPGINPLDQACKAHDGVYENYKDLTTRHKADHELELRAWQRVKSKDANFKEKSAAWLVTNIMKAKQRLGMGCKSKTISRRKINKKKKNIKKKKVTFSGGVIHKVRNEIRKAGGKRFVSSNAQKATHFALQAARRYVKKSGGKRNIRIPRIIPIPKVGGILPLIPIFAGLSALGSLAGGAAGVYKTISDVKNANQRLSEEVRHNKKIESIRLGKKGEGMYIKPYRTGLGLYLKPKISKNF